MVLKPLWNHIFHEFDIYTKCRPKDYALVCIDVFSRYLWAVAMDREDSASTAAAILKIFHHMGIPEILQGDQKIIDYFEKELISHFPGITLIASKPHETNKNAIVKRVIRTLKNDILKYLYVHPFPEKSERLLFEGEKEKYYIELDTTSMVLQEICTLRNRTIHRTIRQKPEDVFYGRAPNRQIITKKKYPQFNQYDLVLAKPICQRGALDIKIFRFDYDIYVIVSKVGDKYQIKSLYNFIHGKKDKKEQQWYKPYKIRKITPQQAFKHLNSPLVQAYLYHVYETIDAIEDMKKYLQPLL
jgi:hypothetical protein